MAPKADEKAAAGSVGEAPRPAHTSGRTPWLWQAALILGVWALMVGMHWENNGLWFQGDAPRHAANGLFWKSYLGDFTLQAKEYALSYYARYPVINPVKYPPFFYLAEAGAFWIVGPSAHVAKSLVLISALIAAIYVSAWLRRWVGPQVGWTAALLLLMPGVVRWSHAVMINIPVVALCLAALYHGRRWLERGTVSLRSRQLWLAVSFSALAFLTHYIAIFIVLVIPTFALLSVDPRRFVQRRTLWWLLLGLLLSLPLYFFLQRWTPADVMRLTRSLLHFWHPLNWAYYPVRFAGSFGLTLSTLSAVGCVVGVVTRRWRREIVTLTVWMLVTYCFLSVLGHKDPRYILFLAPPVVCTGSLAVAWAAGHLSRLAMQRPQLARAVGALAVLTVLSLAAQTARATYVPVISGLAEVAAFLEEVAPEEPVFFDGEYNGVFTFHVQASDPDFRRRVVLGNKLLYTYAMQPGVMHTDFVSSPEEVVEVLRTQGGCRWLAVEHGDRRNSTPGMRFLRQALKGPEFQLVRSFPVEGQNVERVDVYRMSGTILEQTKVRLPIRNISSETLFEIEPIAPRSRGG